MVRTKDLLLFALILVTLLITISATLASKVVKEQVDSPGQSAFSNEDGPAYSATVPESATDREANIERLRSMIAKGDVIEASPSVESAPVAESQAVGTDCSVPSTGIEIARTWPLTGVEQKTVGATRVVSQVTYAQPELTTSTSSASTPVVLSEKLLIQLPAYPVKQNEPTCLDSEIIGITVEGSLIFNNDAVLYQNSGSATLIGYARDGFPIYGVYQGEKDVCGGYDGVGGYRYAVTPGESNFLACFSAVPRPFNQ